MEATARSELTASLAALTDQVQHLRGIDARLPFETDVLGQADFHSRSTQAFDAEWPAELLNRHVQLAAFLGLEAPVGASGATTTPPGDASPLFAAPDGTLVIPHLALTPADILLAACAIDQALVRQTHAPTTACGEDLDACLAQRALIAGDAALLTEQWWRTFGDDRTSLPQAAVSCVAAPSAPEITAHLAGVLHFPAEQGLAFVRALYLAGGWSAVDAAYDTPPRSSEQILHPERYPQDTPRPPELDDLAPSLGGTWTMDDTGVLGEWRTLLALHAHLEPAEAAKAAAGWDGDQYMHLVRAEDGSQAWLLLTRWDTVRDAHEFLAAFRPYGEARFGTPRRTATSLTWETDGGIIALEVGNDQTLWIQAPEAASLEALRSASGFPLY